MSIRLVTLKDLVPVLEFSSHVFISDEPLCKAVNCTKEEFVQCFFPIVYECCKSGLSFVVEEDNHIISCALTLRNCVYLNLVLEVSSSMKSVDKILSDLNALSNPNGNDVYIFLLATDVKCRNSGYGRLITHATLEAAKTQLFDGVIADVTNIISQHVLTTHFRFEVLGETRYDEFIFDGFKPFLNIQGTYSVQRVYKKLYKETNV
jgi:hypothetical protein